MSAVDHPRVARLLALPAWLYAGVLRLRNRFYDRPGAAQRAGVPVLSVGNLTVGGTGKTPTVAWLVRQAQALGARPAVVSRGYGGSAGAGPLLVSDGEGPLVPSRQCGDEPWMLARALPGALVIVGADRVAGARAAARAGADVVVLDDGFQHRRLARDLDLVLIAAGTHPERQRLLPAGRLREPWTALARADVVLVTRARSASETAPVARWVRRHNARAPVLRAIHRPLGFVDRRGAPAPAPSRAVAFCAIGDPAAFRSDLETLGVAVPEFHAFRDHHPYRDDELDSLAREARRHAAALVTTEKDLARLGPRAAALEEGPLLGLSIDLQIHEAEPLLRAVREVLGR